jgi:outer membrane protein assembly factor BamD (BamD/ComL family)
VKPLPAIVAVCSPALAGLLGLLLMTSPVTAAEAEDPAERRLQEARRVLEREGPEAAAERLQALARRHPGSEAAAAALWELFRLHEAAGRHRAAFDALDGLVTRQPGHFARAHAQQLLLVRRLLGAGERRTQASERGRAAPVAADEAVAMLARIVLNGPHAETGIQARYLLGLALERSGRTDEARAQYEEFTELHAAHELADDAGFQAASIAYQKWRAMQGGSPRDRERAAVLMSWFLNRFPDSDKGAQARACQAELQLAEQRELTALARYYEQRGDERAAAVYYRQLAVKFPGLAMDGSPLRERIAGALESPVEGVTDAAEVGPRRAEGVAP